MIHFVVGKYNYSALYPYSKKKQDVFVTATEQQIETLKAIDDEITYVTRRSRSTNSVYFILTEHATTTFRVSDHPKKKSKFVYDGIVTENFSKDDRREITQKIACCILEQHLEDIRDRIGRLKEQNYEQNEQDEIAYCKD
jgi:hypothetical protein